MVYVDWYRATSFASVPVTNLLSRFVTSSPAKQGFLSGFSSTWPSSKADTLKPERHKANTLEAEKNKEKEKAVWEAREVIFVAELGIKYGT